MGFRLKPKSMNLDDLELLQVQIFREFHVISQIWEWRPILSVTTL